MSVDEVVVGQYVKLTEAKKSLDITDNVDDQEIITIVKEANQDLEIAITPVADAVPIPDGTAIFKALGRTGLIYVRARWKEKKHNFKLAETLDKLYSEKLMYIVKALESEPTDRTKSFIISQDPREGKLPLPTQYANFVFDDFA